MMAIDDRLGTIQGAGMADGMHEARLLLPWRSTGRLDSGDADAIDTMLMSDAALAEDYRQVCEQKALIVRLHDGLGVPSSRVLEQLFASIDREASSAEKRIGL